MPDGVLPQGLIKSINQSINLSLTSTAPSRLSIPLDNDVGRVTRAQASSPVRQSIGPQVDSPHLQITTFACSTCNSRIIVSNTVASHSGRALQQNSTNNSAFVTID